MIARNLPLALLAFASLSGASADGRTVSTGGSERLLKPEQRLGPMHWAGWLDDQRVQIFPHPHHVTMGSRFDIVDERGFVGKVAVDGIDETDGGCGIMYEIATARWVSRPSRSIEGQAFAVAPSPLTTTRARLMQPEDARSMPPVNKDMSESTLPLDLDGDQDPELVRVYFYDCELKGEKVVRSRRGNGNSCAQTWARLQKKWRLIDSGVIEPCY